MDVDVSDSIRLGIWQMLVDGIGMMDSPPRSSRYSRYHFWKCDGWKYRDWMSYESIMLFRFCFW